MDRWKNCRDVSQNVSQYIDSQAFFGYNDWMIRIFLLVFVFLFSLWFGDHAFAQYTLDDSLQHLQVPVDQRPEYQAGAADPVTGEAEDTTTFLGKIGRGLVTVLTSVAIFMVTYNALNLVLAAGSQDKIAKSKKAMIWIFLGLLSVMGAYIVVKTVITLPFSAG